MTCVFKKDEGYCNGRPGCCFSAFTSVKYTVPGSISIKFLQALDEGTQRLLGSLTLPLSSLLKEPKLELYQQTLMLTHGVHQSPLVATIRLRVSFFSFIMCRSYLRNFQGAKQRKEHGDVLIQKVPSFMLKEVSAFHRIKMSWVGIEQQ